MENLNINSFGSDHFVLEYKGQ